MSSPLLQQVGHRVSQQAWLYLLFFVSGSAGLIFEQLWFRLAGLSFGNTVWASTTVLAAFMGGLALGNALASWGRLRLARPLLWYAAVEAAIAISGITLILLLPNIGQWLTAFPELPGLRMGLAFLLMLLPATAMGLTLPLVVRALYTEHSYASLLGRLYGINTLGAVAGVLAAEYWLIGRLGVLGTGLLAGGLNLAAAVVALWLNRSWPGASEPRTPTIYPLMLGARWLLISGLSGALLLALEVVWFRLLLLHVRGTATVFAAMLAIVLAGIGIGGLLAALRLRWRTYTQAHTVFVILIAALTVALGYRFLPAETGLSVWLGSAGLMLATAIASGALFPMLCAGYAEALPEPSRATARMLVANTTGGMLGAALAGLVLLPEFGVHISLCLLMLGYLLCAGPLVDTTSTRLTWGAIGLGSLILFPWQGMQKHLDSASEPWRELDGSRVIYQREGLNETVQLLQRELFGEPLAHRVVTNGDSMSGTERDSRRYMKLFAWLPMALHPGIKDVLLISYGLGSTAEALVSDADIKTISVVDISPEILEASRLTRIDAAEPLDDPRVQVRIEDGRHYLLTTSQQFDLITGEPPPPRLAGIVNLYTREYFQLMRERLKAGGLVSYWLPVDQLTLDSSRAILAAFCSAFPDCSLWSGSNYNWIMLGTRDGLGPLKDVQLQRLWTKAGTARDITALGLETPAQLGATFIADARTIAHWTDVTAPLTDNFPKRLHESGPDAQAMRTYAEWMDNRATAERFAASAFIRQLWPFTLMADAVGQFELQPILNNELRLPLADRLKMVDGILEYSALRIPIFWLLDSGIREQRIVDRHIKKSGYHPDYAWHLGVRALAERRYSAAGQMFGQAVSSGTKSALEPAVYSLCRAGETDTAKALALQTTESPALRCW